MAEKTFAEDLDAAITRAKERGEDLAELIADMECAIEGLTDELTL